MDDLHISQRLHQLLPPLTKEEKQQLKDNIAADGQVFTPILYWFDGDKNLVVDGMHRWEIIRGTDIPYSAEEMEFESIEDAELWILEHQLGQRNLLKPAAIRKLVGQLYNRLKGQRGGDRKSKGQIVPLIDTAQKVSEKTGLNPKTVKRLGAHEEALDKLTKAASYVAEKLSDSDVKTLSSLTSQDQDAVARPLRTGQATTVSQAIKLAGVKAPKRQRASKKPKRQLDRSGWWKQFDKAIAPVVKLVDKIASEVGEKHGEHHKAVQDLLEQAGNEMAEWLGVD